MTKNSRSREQRPIVNFDHNHNLQWFYVLLKAAYYCCVSTFNIVFDEKNSEFRIETSLCQQFICWFIRALTVLGSLHFLNVYRGDQELHEAISYIAFIRGLFFLAAVFVIFYIFTIDEKFLRLFNFYFRKRPVPLPQRGGRWKALFKTMYTLILIHIFFFAYFLLTFLYQLSSNNWSLRQLAGSNKERINLYFPGQLSTLKMDQNNKDARYFHMILYLLTKLPSFYAVFAIILFLSSMYFYVCISWDFYAMPKPSKRPKNKIRFLRELSTLRRTIKNLNAITCVYLPTYIVGFIPAFSAYIGLTFFPKYPKILIGHYIREWSIFFWSMHTIAYTVHAHEKLVDFISDWRDHPEIARSLTRREADKLDRIIHSKKNLGISMMGFPLDKALVISYIQWTITLVLWLWQFKGSSSPANELIMNTTTLSPM